MKGAPSSTKVQKYLGKHTFQMDEKGRVALPADFRRDAGEQRFILIQAYAPSLTLYPEAEWAKVEERLQEMRQRQPEARLFVQSVTANALEVVPDSQGRILVPARLKAAAELEGQVVLVGAIDRIELWNPKRFDEAMSIGTKGFEQYAGQIFQ